MHQEVLSIGGVALTLKGVLEENSAFEAPFKSFIGTNATDDLTMRLFAKGSTPAFADGIATNLPYWSFSDGDECCSLTRCDYEGRILWRIEGPHDFSDATVSWRASAFEDFYGSYRYSLYKGVGKGALVMRLRLANGIVLHGAGAGLDGIGVIATGSSGKGKSTISRLLDAAGATLLSDERLAIRNMGRDAGFRMYGTPWPSSAGFALNESAALKRLYFIEHGSENKITPITAAEAVRRLIPVTMAPWQSPTLVDPCLRTIEALVQSVPAARCAFVPTAAVVDALRSDLEREARIL